MNGRARRCVQNKKGWFSGKVSDDDFESAPDSSSESGDFSASEEEWLPGSGKDKRDQNGCAEPETRSDEISEDYTESSDESESLQEFQCNKRSKGIRASDACRVQPKKRRLSPGTRDKLYKRTKTQLLKETKPDQPPLNSSIIDILKQCEYQKKRSSCRGPMASAEENCKDGSESSGDDHLVNPQNLNLNSDFFTHADHKQRGNELPQFDCNAGMNLSDSSDEEEPSCAPVALGVHQADVAGLDNNGIIDANVNFTQHEDFTRKIDAAKQLFNNYKSTQSATGKENNKTDNVSNLLALGEIMAGTSLKKSAQASQLDDVSDGASDWEEVEDMKNSQPVQELSKELSVQVETTKCRKKRWEEIEMELYIKRQINKTKREQQLALHKTSILCSIAAGQILNQIINSTNTQAIFLSLMQAKACSKKDKQNAKFVEHIRKWYKETFVLTDEQMFDPMVLDIRFKLAFQLYNRKVASKRDYLMLFLACLRATGLRCRLVISAVVPPKRPAMKDLCPISERQLIEQFESEYMRKGQHTEVFVDTSENNPVKIETIVNQSKRQDCSLSLGDKAVTIKDTAKANVHLNTSVENKIKKESNPNSGRKIKVSHLKEEAKGSDIQTSLSIPENSVTISTHSDSQCSVPDQSTVENNNTWENITGKRSQEKQKCKGKKLDIRKSSTIGSVSPSSKENQATRRSLRISISKARENLDRQSIDRKAFNTLNLPQLDGNNDITSTPKTTVQRKHNLRSRAAKKGNSNVSTPFEKRKTNTPLAKEVVAQPGKISKRKLFIANKLVKEEARSLPDEKRLNIVKNKILSTGSSSESLNDESPLSIPHVTEISPCVSKKRKMKNTKGKKYISSDDSDFELPVSKKILKGSSPSATKYQKVNNEKSKLTTKVNSKKGSQNLSPYTAAEKFDMWIEFYSEENKRWITLDLTSGKMDCPEYIARHATSPISYIFGFDNDNHIKDVTSRYVPHWNTVCRKLRVDQKWLNVALKPFLAEKTECEQLEDIELNKIHIDKPLPTTITECKNHPLYVLKRHLLKFEAIYPPEPAALGFVRGEAIYARECVFILHTREKWYKQGRVVKPFETAYKMVKCWKFDKLKNEWLANQPCEIFGIWQTEEYDPPTAENGKVPRNEYGNVELFTPKMLPKKTIHLQLPGLNKVCRRLGIDCAPALTGFDKARMRMIPIYDGFVVCEEFGNQVVEEWYKEMEEEERKEQEKYEKRVYGNWKKLIKGLFVRRKLQNKYNFDNL